MKLIDNKLKEELLMLFFKYIHLLVQHRTKKKIDIDLMFFFCTFLLIFKNCTTIGSAWTNSFKVHWFSSYISCSQFIYATYVCIRIWTNLWYLNSYQIFLKLDSSPLQKISAYSNALLCYYIGILISLIIWYNY